MSKAFTDKDMDALCKRMDDGEVTMKEALEIIAKADEAQRMKEFEDDNE